MNQYFLDEIKCIFNEIAKKKRRPRAYADKKVTVVCDEHSLAAYLAGYYASVCDGEAGGAVNVIAEGEWQNKDLYDEILKEYPVLGVYDDDSHYLNEQSLNSDDTVFYIANLQLAKYAERDIFEEKKKNL